MTKHPFLRHALLSFLVLGLTACATSNAELAPDDRDPYEGLNRKIYEFNKTFDRQILRPISAGYRAVMPKPARDGVSNAMRNLRDPWVLINDILQLKFERAFNSLARFTINTTLGVGGLFKVSDEMGIPYHSEDLGQTFAVWGYEDSPYFMIPFVGPSTSRDFLGFTGYFFLDPVNITLNNELGQGTALTRTGIDVLDARVRLHDSIDQLYEEDDPYVIMRSLYFQNRNYEIHDGDPPADEEEEDFFDSLEDDYDEEGDGR